MSVLKGENRSKRQGLRIDTKLEFQKCREGPQPIPVRRGNEDVKCCECGRVQRDVLQIHEAVAGIML